jgi:CRISPR-associated protein Csh2
VVRTKTKEPARSDAQLAKRAEILFFYDARMSNPNGDPDENRPRIDRSTGKNYVTEFRLKRTIRDYLSKVMGSKIFMRQELASPKGLVLKQIEDLASEYIKGSGKSSTIDRTKLLNDHIDIKLFGILFAVGDVHFKQIGPVQFSIGQSLNKVEEIPIRMTRVIPTKAGAEAGTFGEKSIVRYSFIEFHGFVNNNAAKEVNLTEEEVRKMLTAMWKGTDSLSTSSKFGQQSRLLIKVNHKEDGYIGGLDLKCNLKTNAETLENISQLVLDVQELLDTLSKNKEIIESVEYEYNSELVCKYDAKPEISFEEIIKDWSDKSGIKASRLKL